MGIFLLRYLQVMLMLFGGAMFIIWPILIPINATGSGAEGVSGVDLLSISNVDESVLEVYGLMGTALLDSGTLEGRLEGQ